jgi:UDP-glucuronate 4-epimerase
MKKILVTGCAGFIGFHLSKLLLEKENIKIVGIDNINDYYDPKLKNDRLNILKKNKKFIFYKFNLINKSRLIETIKKENIEIIFHLAAQAGVRHSLESPEDYIDNNITVFLNILESARSLKIKKILYASSSSVYGDCSDKLLNELSKENPAQFYAISKKTNELMASAYSQLFKLNLVGIRFFTVYGPYGRPDMALFKFTKNILNSQSIEIFNKGKHKRNFTYVTDAVQILYEIYKFKFKKRHEIFNIANIKNYSLSQYIKEIEACLNKKAKKKFLPLQLGDIANVRADISKILKVTKYKNFTPLKIGVERFISWYKKYYNVK